MLNEMPEKHPSPFLQLKGLDKLAPVGV